MLKRVQIRSFPWPLFSCILTKHGHLLFNSLYTVQIQEKNTDHKNSEFGHFLYRGYFSPKTAKNLKMQKYFSALAYLLSFERFSWQVTFHATNSYEGNYLFINRYNCVKKERPCSWRQRNVISIHWLYLMIWLNGSTNLLNLNSIQLCFL